VARGMGRSASSLAERGFRLVLGSIPCSRMRYVRWSTRWEGGVAGLIMDSEGIAVESYARDVPGGQLFDINVVGTNSAWF